MLNEDVEAFTLDDLRLIVNVREGEILGLLFEKASNALAEAQQEKARAEGDMLRATGKIAALHASIERLQRKSKESA